MAWPTTSVSTANVDQGIDSPTQARAQLKDMVDTINQMADEFGDVNLTSAVEGDIMTLQNGVWKTEQLYEKGYVATLTIDYGANGIFIPTIMYDGGIDMSITNTTMISLPPGTYLFEQNHLVTVNAGNQYDIYALEWYCVTSNNVIAQNLSYLTGHDSSYYYIHNALPLFKFSHTVRSSYQIKYVVAVNWSITRPTPVSIKITKIL